jgi:hypothetical protein
MIRRDTAGYPASINDGIQVYFDTGTSFTDTGLEPETTYYYRAWSEVTGSQQWSDSYADASATTPSGPTSPTTVGGTIFPINKMAIIVPWIGSLVIMSFAAAGTVLWLRRKLTTTPKPIYDRIKSPR